MYVILGKELADVDQSEFDKIGIIASVILALPTVNVRLAVKGMCASSLDSVDAIQNTAHISYEVPENACDFRKTLATDSFQAGAVYERKGKRYVELGYKYHFGIMGLFVYFLVPLRYCVFGYYNKFHDFISDVTFEELQDLDYYVRINNG